MLISLTLQNFALIDQCTIDFDAGFNVITGETGAGKSLILDALSLCMGGRADASMVRVGHDEATIFGEFDVSDNQAVQAWFEASDRPFEEVLLIRRKVGVSGRSKSWINGVPASLSELKALGGLLVNIHSQHAGLELLKPQFVIDWLDEVGDLLDQKQQVATAYQTWQTLKKQAIDIKDKSAQRADRMTLLSVRLGEVEPLLGVDLAQIEQEYDELSDLENLMQSAVQAVGHLENDEFGVSALLARSLKICDQLSDKSRVFAECGELLTQATEQIDDAVAKLMGYAEQSLPDEERLDELNQLMGLAHRLAKKYHTTTDELTQQALQWQAELDELEALPDVQTLDKEVSEAFDRYTQVALTLSQSRQNASLPICQRVQDKLKDLALPNARLMFEFHPKQPDDYSMHGIDDISLLFGANVGMPMQPLHKVASGGELSRMALIMQVMSADTGGQACPILVFDEVDVGISGGTAQVVGKLLRTLGKHHQLIAITHQAQVAGAGHRHILVAKEHGEQTTSTITTITDQRQVEELARMSGGVQITEATLAHARQLLADVAHDQ